MLTAIHLDHYTLLETNKIYNIIPYWLLSPEFISL
jgi:hypothetical protein